MYRSIDELPKNIKTLLPRNMSREVIMKYLRAFNNSYNIYLTQMRREVDKYEQMAHLVAWNEIKKHENGMKSCQMQKIAK